MRLWLAHVDGNHIVLRGSVDGLQDGGRRRRYGCWYGAKRANVAANRRGSAIEASGDDGNAEFVTQGIVEVEVVEISPGRADPRLAFLVD